VSSYDAPLRPDPDGAIVPIPQTRSPSEWDGPSLRYAWFVVAVLVIASIVSYADRQIVALLVTPIKRDLSLTDAEVGWLYGAFAIFFAVAALPLALATDRISRRLMVGVGIALWTAMAAASGVASGFSMLLVARVGVGIGEAVLTPAAHSLLGDYFPRKNLPLAVAVYQAAGTLGTGIAFIGGAVAVAWIDTLPPLHAGNLGVLAPWQLAFLVVSAPGLIVLLLLLGVREPRRRGRVYSAQLKAPLGLLAFYRRNARTLFAHHVGYGTIALAGYGVVFWSPTFFRRIHGASATESGIKLGLIMLIFGTAATYIGAWIGQRMYRRGLRDWPMRTTLAFSWPMVPLMYFATKVGASAAWLLYGPLVFFINIPFGVAYGALPIIAPGHLRARVAAVFLIVGSAVGMGLGPVILGAISDHLYPQPDGVRHSLVFLMTACAPIWIAVLLYGRRAYADSLLEAERIDASPADRR
jgi:MFS family permease